jgi:glycosyltransferase A (GT-A) superfamily protein (DUF2064 family)
MADSGTAAAPALLILLCRPPNSPASKTRLVADVGARRAREVYERCLDAVLAAANRVPADLRVAVAGRPLELADRCARWAGHAELVRQRGTTFAERQRNELRRGLADGYHRVAIMASDLLTVTPEDIAWALAPEAPDVRIVPSQDGGYCVLSTNSDLPVLERTAMSRTDTRAQLVALLAASGKTVRVADFEIVNINHGRDLAALGHDVALT